MPELDRWPELLREVAERVSPEAALKLVTVLGGQRIQIPTTARNSKLIDLVGQNVATVLIDLYGGTSISVPNFHSRIAEERRRHVLTNPLKSANRLASDLGITVRRVEQIRSENRADPRQLSLL